MANLTKASFRLTTVTFANMFLFCFALFYSDMLNPFTLYKCRQEFARKGAGSLPTVIPANEKLRKILRKKSLPTGKRQSSNKVFHTFLNSR